MSAASRRATPSTRRAGRRSGDQGRIKMHELLTLLRPRASSIVNRSPAEARRDSVAAPHDAGRRRALLRLAGTSIGLGIAGAAVSDMSRAVTAQASPANI